MTFVALVVSKLVETNMVPEIARIMPELPTKLNPPIDTFELTKKIALVLREANRK